MTKKRNLKKQTNKLVSGVLVATMAAGFIAPMQNAVFAGDEQAQTVSDTVQKAKNPFETVYKVNGRVIDRFQEVFPGDNIVSDTVFYAKNGLLQDFRITLPDKVVFNPDNQHALTVHNVNDDGTIGDEITSEGTISIKGQTIHWTPKDPTKYVYKQGGKQNRIIFHLNAHIQADVNPGLYLNILTEGTLKDKTTGAEEIIKSQNNLHVADVADTPVVKNGVYQEDKDGYISALLPNGKAISKPEVVASLADKEDSVITISSEDKIDVMKAQVAKAVKKAKEAAVPTETLEKLASELKEDSTYEQKVEVVREFERVAKGYEGALAKAIFSVKDDATYDELSKLAPSLVNNAKQLKTIDVSKLEKLIKNFTPKSTEEEKKELIAEFKKVAGEYKTSYLAKLKKDKEQTSSNIQLENKDSKFSVVVDGRFPDRAVKGSIMLRTELPNYAKIDQSKIKVYNSAGEDITARGKVKISKGLEKTMVGWEADYSLVKEMREKNADKDIQLRIGGLSIDGEQTELLAKSLLNGKVAFETKGMLVFDSIVIQSKPSFVYASDDISKSVLGKAPGTAELNKEVQDLKSKLEKLEKQIQDEKDAQKKAELEKEKAKVEKEIKDLEEKDSKFKKEQEDKSIKELEEKEKSLKDKQKESDVKTDKGSEQKDVNKENKTETPKETPKDNTKSLLDYYNKTKDKDNTVKEVEKQKDTPDQKQKTDQVKENTDYLQFKDKNGNPIKNGTLRLTDKETGKVVEYKLDEQGRIVKPTTELAKQFDKSDITVLNEKGEKVDYDLELSKDAEGRLLKENKDTVVFKQADKKADVKTGIENPVQNGALAVGTVLAMLLGFLGYRKFNK